MADEEPTTSGEANNDHAGGKKSHKHDSGAADLEKVTDFVEEKELAIGGSNVDTLIAKEKDHAPAPPVTKITIRKEDVELIVRELEVPKQMADAKLRQHRGDVKAALNELLGFDD